MRFGLIDLLFLCGCMFIGTIGGQWLAPDLSPKFRFLAGLLAGTGLYLVLVYPFYRKLRLLPMILPRCPCCAKFQPGFHFFRNWPRVRLRCPGCHGEFVIWHNGKVGSSETWERPVLVLGWPYAWGTYRRIKRPPNGGSALQHETSPISHGPPLGS